jgi:hypothetical protein
MPFFDAIGGLLGGDSGGGGSPTYAPTGLSTVDTSWQDALKAQKGIADQTQTTLSPYYQQSLQQGQTINYSPYLQSQRQAGQQYGAVGNLAQQQMSQYGQQAGIAGQQQQSLYGAGNQLYQTSLDPQNALYDRTQQQLTDQVRAGQAARGLGNSAVGGAEENQAMSNFNIDWQNQQLSRQLQGVQGLGQASAAGAQQGQLQGADQAAALGAGSQAAGYYGQAGQVPLQAQQYAAAQPGAVAQQYQTQQQGLQGLYGNLSGQYSPYLNAGQGAQQFNYNANTAQNSANSQLGAQLGKSFGGSSAGQGVSDWFGNAASTIGGWFGGGGSSGGGGVWT